MAPKAFEPKNGERGRDDCCPEHDAKLGERLIPARREPDQQLSKKFDFLHHLRDRFAQGIDLTKGEAVGIDLGHIAYAAVGMRRKVAYCWLIPDYRAGSPLRSGQHHV